MLTMRRLYMVLYLVKYSISGNDPGSHLKPAHLEYMQKLYNEGVLITAGLFLDRIGGYLLLKTPSLEETKKIIENDPYIINKVRNYEIIPWDVSPFPLKNIVEVMD